MTIEGRFERTEGEDAVITTNKGEVIRIPMHYLESYSPEETLFISISNSSASNDAKAILNEIISSKNGKQQG